MITISRNLFPILSKDFGKRLHALMEFHNISTSDLSIRLLGYTEKPKSDTQEYLNCKNKEKTIRNHLKLGELSKQGSSKSLASCFLAEYCNFFNCSADYLLGYIDYPTHSYEDIGSKTDLSINAIKMLEIWKSDKSKNNILSALPEQSIEALNSLLEYSYDSYQSDYSSGFSIFYYIGSYINADNIIRDTNNRMRFRSGSRWFDMKTGDKYISSETGNEFIIENLASLSEITNDKKKVGLIDINDSNKCYTANISELYRASALNNITEILFKIKDSLKNKE